MDLQSITDESLRELHSGLRLAFSNDEDIRSANLVDEAQEFTASFDPKKVNPLEYFGTDQFPDWATAVDEIEGELTRRQLPFNPVK